MTQAIKVSKAGVDVGTATNPNDFIFDSTLNTFKIVATGTTSGLVSGTPTTISVAHGQSGIPAVFAFARFPDGEVAMPCNFERAGTTPDIADRRWNVETDGTNVRFDFYKGGGANYTPVIRYYVFEAPAKL